MILAVDIKNINKGDLINDHVDDVIKILNQQKVEMVFNVQVVEVLINFIVIIIYI